MNTLNLIDEYNLINLMNDVLMNLYETILSLQLKMNQMKMKMKK